jgi:hypothetical protein
MTTKSGKWKAGIWYPAEFENHKLMVNNPKGYGKTKKNPEVKIVPISFFDQFVNLTDIEQRRLLKELHDEIFAYKKEIAPKLIKFTKCRNYYEAKHFGWQEE